jgi:tetratricopeptide (TPR) repeat protein
MQKKVDQSLNKKRLQNQEKSEPELERSNDEVSITPDSLRGRTLMALFSNSTALKLPILRDIADSTYSLGFHHLAISAYEELIRMAPHQDFDVYNNLSDAYFQVGDHQKSIEAIKRYLELNPSDTLGLYNLALVCERAKQYDEAIKYYNQLLAAEGDTALVHRGLGEAYLAIDDIESALKEHEILRLSFRNTPDFEELSNVIKGKRDALSTVLNKFSGWPA